MGCEARQPAAVRRPPARGRVDEGRARGVGRELARRRAALGLELARRRATGRQLRRRREAAHGRRLVCAPRKASGCGAEERWQEGAALIARVKLIHWDDASRCPACYKHLLTPGTERYSVLARSSGGEASGMSTARLRSGREKRSVDIEAARSEAVSRRWAVKPAMGHAGGPLGVRALGKGQTSVSCPAQAPGTGQAGVPGSANAPATGEAGVPRATGRPVRGHAGRPSAASGSGDAIRCFPRRDRGA